jgi:hypothetical protein
MENPAPPVAHPQSLHLPALIKPSDQKTFDGKHAAHADKIKGQAKTNAASEIPTSIFLPTEGLFHYSLHDLTEMKMKQLKEICKQVGFTGHTELKSSSVLAKSLFKFLCSSDKLSVGFRAEQRSEKRKWKDETKSISDKSIQTRSLSKSQNQKRSKLERPVAVAILK